MTFPLCTNTSVGWMLTELLLMRCIHPALVQGKNENQAILLWYRFVWEEAFASVEDKKRKITPNLVILYRFVWGFTLYKFKDLSSQTELKLCDFISFCQDKMTTPTRHIPSKFSILITVWVLITNGTLSSLRWEERSVVTYRMMSSLQSSLRYTTWHIYIF